MNKINCSKIYNGIIFINLISAISYCIVGYLSVDTPEGGANYAFHLTNSVNVIYANIVITTLLFLIVIIKNLNLIKLISVLIN